MRKKSCIRFALLGLALAFMLGSPEAQAGWQGAGCWTCKYIGLTGTSAYCDMVGNGETGEGTNCYSAYVYGEYCRLNGVLCYNTEVDGGGGGGGGGGGFGGGGGGSCTVGPSAPCPAQCMSCERQAY